MRVVVTGATGNVGWSKLEWRPTRTAQEVLTELLEGLSAGHGAPTEPLAPDSLDGRAAELRSGVGAH